MKLAYGNSSSTLFTKIGMFMELVANPMPKTIAASTSRNEATNFSSSCTVVEFPGGVESSDEKF